MKIGYSRVSTARQGQPFETQREALLDAGCDAQHLHSDTISGTNWSRPVAAALAVAAVSCTLTL